jgi:hypothetical protein
MLSGVGDPQSWTARHSGASRPARRRQELQDHVDYVLVYRAMKRICSVFR